VACVIDREIAPTMRLAAALVNTTREQDGAIGSLIAQVMNSNNCEAMVDSLVNEFKVEYEQLQCDPASKSAKQVRASRGSDLKAVLKAAFMVESFQSEAQSAIDAGKGGLQGLAKLARAMMKPAKTEHAEPEAAEGEGEGEAEVVPDLAQALSDALHAANAANRFDVADIIIMAMAKL
jgi:hypothetical protein